MRDVRTNLTTCRGESALMRTNNSSKDRLVVRTVCMQVLARPVGGVGLPSLDRYEMALEPVPRATPAFRGKSGRRGGLQANAKRVRNRERVIDVGLCKIVLVGAFVLANKAGKFGGELRAGFEADIEGRRSGRDVVLTLIVVIMFGGFRIAAGRVGGGWNGRLDSSL